MCPSKMKSKLSRNWLFGLVDSRSVVVAKEVNCGCQGSEYSTCYVSKESVVFCCVVLCCVVLCCVALRCAAFTGFRNKKRIFEKVKESN